MSKSGFSTLNRWLGRKNKDKSVPNGKLSKSSTNLSISTTNINETSQLEYNRITPLPAATTNAPFEQTFRITVLLPKDQLYVTRLGARIPLSKLLELVCDNKLLDAQKYEFRNPVDPSQVYSCDLTIGAVGLSEIRLCLKSEPYDSYSNDEIMKLQRSSLIRESLTSSEFSSRNSKHTTKTTSPYSSSNSLNSMDSSGVTYSRVLVAGPQPKLPPSSQPKMAAPPRKKRAAPRPPSQTAIPEKSPLIIENGRETQVAPSVQAAESPLVAKDFSISTPNLASSTLLHSDINGNDCNGHVDSSATSNGYTEDTVLYAQVQKKNALNLNSASVQNLTSSPSPSPMDGDNNCTFPEPSPRKKIVVVKKKMVAPPAPQPRSSMYSGEDSESIASTHLSSAPSTPVALKTPLQDFDTENPKLPEAEPLALEEEPVKDIPKPQPRITTTTTLLNATDVQTDLKNFETDSNKSQEPKGGSNVSKVLLNRTPTPEPRSLSCEPPDMDSCYDTHIEHMKQSMDDDNVSKQADSGIGEPVPSPIPDSLPLQTSTLDVKSNFESSSDDDDMVKVYNFKLGKTLVKPLNETKTLEELTIINNGAEEIDSELSTPLTLTQSVASGTPSETSSWNFTIPISPPPNFADSKFAEAFEEEKQEQENPITPKIMERPVLNFEALKQEGTEKAKVVESPTLTPVTPLEKIVGELSTIIQEKGLDTLIKKSEETLEIESAKPNPLANFTISSGSKSNLTKPKEVQSEQTPPPQQRPTEMDKSKTPTPTASPTSSPDEEKLYRKRNSITSLKQRRSITRSDSFHTTAVASENSNLTKRTSSQISLDQMASNLNRRRSSSELSIGDTPSLQSLEIMKTILNSRKNSLIKSAGDEAEEKPLEVNPRRPSEELQFTSLELKSKLYDRAKSEELKESPTEQSKENMKKIWERRIPQSPEEETNKESEQEIAQKSAEENNDSTDSKPKELLKVYRYSGPPSINFSTWNERPKVQVAIKNEGDYIFGGKLNETITKTVPRNYRMSMPAAVQEQQETTPPPPPPVAPKPGTIRRMGIPEKEYKVPIVVKPIQDVIVENVVSKPTDIKVVQNGEVKSSNEATPKPEAPEVMPNGDIKILRPSIQSVLKPQTQIIVNTSTSTLPRSNKRFSTPVTMTATAVQPAGPQLLRSTSIKQQEAGMKTSASLEETAPQAPFGQNTLRRTGLKEKILAKEEQDKQKAITASIQAAKMANSTYNPKAYSNGEMKFTTAAKFEKPLTNAKLHLNLHKSISVNSSVTTLHHKSTSVVDTSSSTFSSSTSITPTTTTTSATLKFKPSTPKSAPVDLVSPPKPPAPPMMFNLKPVISAKTPTTPLGDPRDQLLAAIKNFNKNDLKKA